MDTMKKIVLVALIGSVMSASTAAAAIALKETVREISASDWIETRKIEENEYLVYKIQANATNTLDIDIEVVSGDAIDMLLLNSGDFPDYQAMMKSGRPAEFNYIPAGKGTNLKYVNYSFEVQEDGFYYIVEDNTYLPNGWGAPGGSVEVKIIYKKNRCLECEEALEEQRLEEARRYEESLKNASSANITNKPASAPGFEIVFPVLALALVHMCGRKTG